MQPTCCDLALLRSCMYVGAVGVTDMNEHSSRSHTMFTITVERCELGPDKKQHVRMGKLHLVDLAVSTCTHTGRR